MLTVLSFAQLADGLEQVKSTLEATESVGRVIQPLIQMPADSAHLVFEDEE